MRRTKTEQIKDIRKAIIENPGITRDGIKGLARIHLYKVNVILSAMKEENMIIINGNKISWNHDWKEEDFTNKENTGTTT